MSRQDQLAERRAALSHEQRALLEKRMQGALAPPSGLQRIPQRPDQDSAPLSYAQERLWFLNQWLAEGAAYSRPEAFRLLGQLDRPALERSLTEIVRRHEILRTTYRTEGGLPVQVVNPSHPVSLPLVDLSHLPQEQREREALVRIREHGRRPVDLTDGPILSGVLYRLGVVDHLLLLITHHLAMDGWSVRVLQRELSTLHRCFAAGRSSPFPALPVQYADFAQWQREGLQQGRYDAQANYWRQKLAGAPSSLDLLTDHGRPIVRSARGAEVSCFLPPSLLESLQALGQNEDVTLFMALLSAYGTLLHRYSRADEVLVGIPVAGRTQVELEELIGSFINTLVLRLDLSGDPTFLDLMGRTRSIALEAFEQQDLPFDKLVEALNPARDPGRPPLVQVLFNHRDFPGEIAETLEAGALRIAHYHLEPTVAQFELNLETEKRDHGLLCRMNYSTDLFEDATVQRMLGHFQRLLETMVEEPGQRIRTAPLLTDRERHQVLVEWCDTGADYQTPLCIHRLFEEQAAQMPNAIAVEFQGQQLSYHELNAWANRLAHHLRKLGVDAEVPVGICMERSLEMLAGLLGILKAGGAYVPLDPALPEERLRFVLEDAGVSVLLTQEHLGSRLKSDHVRHVCLDRHLQVTAHESEENPEIEILPSNLAYIIYTSGSTGQPKGVQTPHQAVVNFLNQARTEPGLRAGDVVLGITSIAFDLSVHELFLTLSVGARLLLVDREVASDGLALATALAESGATLMKATPTTWRMLLEAGWRGSPQLNIVSAGETLTRELADRLLDKGATVWNLYGPTETTASTVLSQVEAGEGPVPVGRPIANARVYILDSSMQPVPVGVPGQIHIGGAGLARGYLNRPGLSANAFVPDPFSHEPGARLYRTGDLGYFRPDGQVVCLGRTDGQVKLRGYRIELGEIEAALTQHPHVREAAVLVREDAPGDRQLVAYVASSQVPKPTAAMLRGFLGKKLPSYMVPSTYVNLDALPQTPNRKLDRRRLPPASTRLRTDGHFKAPRNTLERELSGIWRDVLGVQSLGIRDNFFDLGGHSLLSVRLIIGVNETYGCELSVADLFQAPTVEQMAEVLRSARRQPPLNSSALVPMQTGGSRPPLFFVPGNMGNVFTHLGHLARHLGPMQPFFGFQASVRDPARIESLAALYLQQVHTVQPVGPYFLGGVCHGAAVVFEMAQQLKSRGQEVSLLALVEPSRLRSPALGAYAEFASKIVNQAPHRFGRYLRTLSGQPAAARDEFVRQKIKLVTNSWAVIHYNPKPYPGCMDLFLTAESLASPDSRRLQWQTLATNTVRIHEIPGSHAGVVGADETPIDEAAMVDLATRLKAIIDNECGYE